VDDKVANTAVSN